MKKIYTFAVAFYALTAVNAQTELPYSQDFSTFPPENWVLGYTYSPLVGSGPTNTNSNNWTKKPFLNDTLHNDPSLSINLFTTNISHWAITPPIDLSAGGSHTVSFDIATGKGPWAFPPEGPAPQIVSDDDFKFLVSTDDGITWVELTSIISPNTNIPNEATTITLQLENYNNANTKFAFFASDGTVYDWQIDYTIYIDNLSITKEVLATTESVKPATKLYPNPTNGKVFTDRSKEVKSAEIYNANGQLVSTQKTIDLSAQPSGMYTAKVVYTDGTTSVQKIIRK